MAILIKSILILKKVFIPDIAFIFIIDFMVMKREKHPLFLHKEEWARLKSVGVAQEPRQNNEYLQSLIEKSQQWINSWPDSVQGHILKLEKQKQKQHAKDMAIIKLYKKDQKEIWKKNKRIEEAKQIIFDDSCYGRRLISALLESKTFEERDAQIEFRKKIKEEAAAEDLQKEMEYSLQNALAVKHQEEQAARKVECDKEVASINKNMYLNQCEKVKRKKERQEEMEIEDMRIIAKLNEKEAIQEAIEKELFKKDLEQYNAEQKQIRERKALLENQEDRLIEVWRKYEDKKNSRMKKIHDDRFKKSQSTEHYELIKKINDDKKKSYDDFVNKGITALRQSVQVQDDQDNRQKEDEYKKQCMLMKTNKEHNAKRVLIPKNNICTCDRQCIIAKCRNIPTKQSPRNTDITTFTLPSDKLFQKLKTREKEPSPWSGVSASHAQFARRASSTLRDCRYKLTARKVVDDYRRFHGLEPEDLPVDNYR